MLFACEIFFRWCDARTVESWMLRDTGDKVYTMVYWTLRGFVRASWMVRWRGMNVSWAVVVGESASALGDEKGLCGSCLIRVTSMHDIKSIHLFEDDVT
jgi:hypothetical protein